MDQQKIERELRFLKIYAGIATLVCAVVFLTAFAADTKQRFGEIDVERINVVEKDGKLRMVISNAARQHPGIVNGKVIERKNGRPPGMIFFNHLGDEMGGFVFGENGGKGHFGSITWDKVRGDQTMGFRYLESDNGTYQSGLEMWQQPDIPGDEMVEKVRTVEKIADEKERRAAFQKMIDDGQLTTSRLFLGKRRDNSNELVMADVRGRPRISLKVAPDGTPKLDFLDADGKVIYSLPDDARSKK